MEVGDGNIMQVGDGEGHSGESDKIRNERCVMWP